MLLCNAAMHFLSFSLSVLAIIGLLGAFYSWSLFCCLI